MQRVIPFMDEFYARACTNSLATLLPMPTMSLKENCCREWFLRRARARATALSSPVASPVQDLESRVLMKRLSETIAPSLPITVSKSN